MSLTPKYNATRCETSRKSVLDTGHQCNDGSLPLTKRKIYESEETLIRIVGLYLGVIPLACILALSILFCYGMFYSIINILFAISYIVRDGKIHWLMCVDTYSLN
jgi:hypothetical protein